MKNIYDEIKRGLCRVKTHSKEIEKGDVFVALPGIKKSGVDFISEAIKRGAKYVISSDKKALKYQREVKVVLCEDIFSVLGELARLQYNTFDLPYMVGITGTNGKTTISYLLEYIFKKSSLSVGVVGTISYRWDGMEREANLTTPDCLEIHKLLSHMKGKVDVVIMEVSSHALDQRRVEGINFDMAIFTNLSQDHLDYHENMENYFKAKMKLFSKYLKPNGIGIANLDDRYGKRLIRIGLAPYGYTFFDENFTDPDSTMLLDIVLSNKNHMILETEFRRKRWICMSSLVGRYNAYNLAAVQLAGKLFGLDEKVFYSLLGFKGVPGRLEKVYSNGKSDVYIDYAHTPDGLKNVLCALRELSYKRIILVFGCGGDRDRDKRPKMGKIASKYADFLVITSDNPRSEGPDRIVDDILSGINGSAQYVVEIDRKKAIEVAIENMREGDAVLVAGKGHERYQYLKDKIIEFNDKKVVLDLLNKIHKGKENISYEVFSL